MTIHKYKPSKEDVIRIVMIEVPEEIVRGEGLFEFAFQGQKLLMDVIDLVKELKRYVPNNAESTLDRIYAFHKCFINLTTGEIST